MDIFSYICPNESAFVRRHKKYDNIGDIIKWFEILIRKMYVIFSLFRYIDEDLFS